VESAKLTSRKLKPREGFRLPIAIAPSDFEGLGPLCNRGVGSGAVRLGRDSSNADSLKSQFETVGLLVEQ
jgi:hypothetical protein